MKKYRVVKAYSYQTKYGPGMDRVIGQEFTIASIHHLHDCDLVALQTGALEEIKPWEPKEGEKVWNAYPHHSSIDTFFSGGEAHNAWLKDGLIYPTHEQAEECRKRMLEVAMKYKEEVLGG